MHLDDIVEHADKFQVSKLVSCSSSTVVMGHACIPSFTPPHPLPLVLPSLETAPSPPPLLGHNFVFTHIVRPDNAV